jgi:hypothetical protein
MKRKMTAFIMVLTMMLTLIPAIPVYAASLTVGTGGTYATLTSALTIASDGDTINLISNITESAIGANKSVTIDGQGHTITGAAGSDSTALKLSGSGTIILKNLTLQGGTASSADSTGLTVSGSVNVLSCGTVNAIAGTTPNQSFGVSNSSTGTVNVTTATAGECTGTTGGNQSTGVINYGTGTVNVTTATGGQSGNFSFGVQNAGTGIINVTTAIGGEAKLSYGVRNSTGTVNVNTATGGTATSESYGARNLGTGTVNADTATAGTAATSYGARNDNTGMVNVTNAVGGTAGTVSTGAAFIAHLTLLKGTGAECVLDSITVASGSATTIGTLPSVSKNGVAGAWYTDSAASTPFAGTTVAGETTLYSTFYPDYTITSITNQSMTTLTAGYGAGTQETKTLTVTRTGTGALASLATALSGANAANFTITQPLVTTLNSGTPNTTFTVKANDGLPAGTYTATVTITATNMSAVSFTVTQVVNTASSGGGSHGGGGGTPATSVINTDTGSVTGNQLKNAADAAKDGGTVTVKSGKTSEVTLPNSGFDSLSGKNNSLTVVTEKGTLTFNGKAVAAIGTQAEAADIKVIVDDVVKTTLTEEQQTKVGDKTVYDLSVMSGGKLISSFNGGKVNVSIPYELKTGETAENLTVWYMADNGSLTEINCTYDAKNKAVTFVVDHFSKYIIGYDGLADWVNPFTDVKSSAWYYDAAAFVNVNGLMKGQTDTAFGPQTAMTRGMFVTILGRMEGIDVALYASKNTFSDVKSDQYYAPYIAWATDKGIVSGMGGDKFAPNAAVTREQMAVMMTNYMKLKGQGPTGVWATQLTYSDLDKVSSWADEAVMFMTAKDLMNGMGNDTKGNPLFAPKSTSTRAQTAQVMMSLGELVK